ncbi:MAG: DUF3696 domain-containing protein [Proteiniphilum sp.]
MLHLNIENFKCFYNVTIPINCLTVFAGGNGNGKSTAIQSILLLRRTIEHCSKWNDEHYQCEKINNLNIELNGVYCLGLGNSENILPVNYVESKIELGLKGNDNFFRIRYNTNDGNELYITPDEILDRSLDFPENPLLFQEFYYLNAERIGPRIAQNMKFYDYANVGFQGEFTAQIISDIDSDYTFKIDENRILHDTKYLKGSRFQHHINAWLSYIIDGVTIIPHRDDNTHTSRIEIENSFSKGKPTFPTNTGFGISYSLPIIVSCLIAKKNRILIIENPEAHLHPSAQSKMGFFLGAMASAGVRIIVETHSDHIINGIQIAVAKKVIGHNRVTINYFYREEKTPDEFAEDKVLGIKQEPTVKAIEMNGKGELSEWPKGFFDQSQVDYIDLINIRKRL